MRVGVDATAFGNRHGDGRFARNAVRRLVELDAETRYVLFVDRACFDGAAEAVLPAGAELRRLPLARRPAALSSRRASDLVRLGATASRGAYDALLFPSLVSWFPTARAPTVVGVHDANVARFGALLLPTRRARAAWRLKQLVALRAAARVFTVSEAARRELERHLGLPAAGVDVVPEAPDPAFHPRDPAAARRVTAKLGSSAAGDFLLYASGINPHKGLDALIDACAALIADGRSCPPLVIVGPLEHDEAQSAAPAVRSRIARFGLRDRVLLPGFVDDETLACLYSTATAAVVTSHGEGFGLPAVEAAACGAPVILSDIAAHRETLGDAARYFPPGDSAALGRVLSELIGDPALRHDLAERGRQRVAGLSWDHTARALGRLLRDAAATRAAPGSARRPWPPAPERP